MAKIIQNEVTLPGFGGVKLSGTLVIPVASGAVPALVLLAGSGPSDRDGNQLPPLRTDVLLQFSQALADVGVASLRYDKRGIGKSEPMPKTASPDQLGAFFAWENFVGDAAAALRWLRRQPGILTAKTGFLGHSEGGVLALNATGDASLAPAALVLASTPGRTMDLVIHDQLVRILKKQGASPVQSQFFLDKNDSIAATVRRTGKVPDDVPKGLAALYPPYLGRFLQSMLSFDPAPFAARYPGPVLLLQGARDVQILADKDAPALDTALRLRRPDDHTLKMIANASHCLKLLRSDSDPGFEGPMSPEALKALQDWAKAKLTV